MEGTIDFTPLLLVSALAVVIPFVTWRLTGGLLPAVAGEVVLGMVFGNSVLGLIDENEWLTFLALFGFAYLMFLSGLEINLGVIARRPGDQWWVPAVALRHPLVSAVLMLGLVMAATWGCLMGLERIGLIEGAQLPMLLFILMATAVGVVVPVLKDRPDLGAIGQPLLIAGFLLEFVAIIGVGVVAALERGGIGWRFALLLAIPGALGLLVWLVNYGSDRFPTLPKTLHELAQTSSQLKIRAALALLVMFVALSQTVGTELVLGAFMAGLAATIISPRHGSIVRVKLDALGYGFFVPIFFIHAGATLDLGAVFDSWDAFLLAPLLLAVAFATKMAPALLGFAPVFGVRRGLAGGALLAANLSLVLAAGAIAEEVGIIDAGQHGALLLTALLSTVIAPPLFAWLAGRRSARSGGHALLIGGGQLAAILAERLSAAGRSVVVIHGPHESLPRSVATAGVTVVIGDPTDVATLEAANAAGADVAVITESAAPADAAAIARSLRAVDAELRVVTWVTELNHQLELMEVETYHASEATALALESAVLRPGLYGALSDRDSGLVEVVMRNPRLHGQTLSEVAWPGGTRVLVMLRGGEAVIPAGDTPLYLHDRVTLGGDPTDVADASALLSDASPDGPLDFLREMRR